jgi:hypothetical protein
LGGPFWWGAGSGGFGGGAAVGQAEVEEALVDLVEEVLVEVVQAVNGKNYLS